MYHEYYFFELVLKNKIQKSKVKVKKWLAIVEVILTF
jgi:hypothetical protein